MEVSVGDLFNQFQDSFASNHSGRQGSIQRMCCSVDPAKLSSLLTQVRLLRRA